MRGLQILFYNYFELWNQPGDSSPARFFYGSELLETNAGIAEYGILEKGVLGGIWDKLPFDVSDPK